MGKIVEFRIPLPLTTTEFKKALPYVVTRCSEELSLRGTGDKVEVLTNNQAFEDGERKGTYTHKVFHVSHRLPEWVKTIMPKLRGVVMEEKSWNAFPYVRSVYECNLMGDMFKMEVISMHIDNDTGETENALNLPPEMLKKREVRRINIRNVDTVKGVPHPAEYTPRNVKANCRGPLPNDWIELARKSHRRERKQATCVSSSTDSPKSPSGSQEDEKKDLSSRECKGSSSGSSDCKAPSLQRESSKDSLDVKKPALAEESKAATSSSEKMDSDRPVMCAYKIVKLHVKIWPIQERCEQFMLSTQVEKGITEVCVRAWTWLDEYIDMTQQDIKDFERDSIKRLQEALNPEKKKVPDTDGIEEESETEGISEAEAAAGGPNLDNKVRGSRNNARPYLIEGADDTPTCKMVPELKLPLLKFLSIPLPPLQMAKLKRLMTYLNFASDEKEDPQVQLPPRVPPTWISDSIVARCKGCKKEFSILVRKHHCRGCGQVMCHSCTSHMRLLSQYAEYYGPMPQRVCSKCNKRQTEAENTHRRKLTQNSKLKSPTEVKMRRSIREKARLHALQQKQPDPESDFHSRRMIKLFVFFSTVLVVVLAVAASKPKSPLGNIIMNMMRDFSNVLMGGGL
mmetsp:Transcript_25006/g.34812  ORF Transcript_25006/g.34812 Transcript_25006/m.34812 type:complete len:625 (-) Transcript_25006:99-1973(-)